MIKKNIDLMMGTQFETPVGKTTGDYVNYLNEKANSTYTTMDKRYSNELIFAECFLLDLSSIRPSHSTVND